MRLPTLATCHRRNQDRSGSEGDGNSQSPGGKNEHDKQVVAREITRVVRHARGRLVHVPWARELPVVELVSVPT